MKKTLTIITSIFLSTNTLVGQSTVDTKTFGQNILNGKVKPTDDIKTFRTLDSLLCKNKSDKIFYFKVANKIQQTSDGALSEHVSTVFSDYYFNQCSEFMEKSKTIVKADIYKWLDFIAFDLYADSKNGEKDLPAIKTKIKLLEKKCSSDNIAALKRYNDYLYQKTEHFIKTD